MTSLTLHYDTFEDDFTVRYPLPFLSKFGVRTILHDAVHKAATHRNIVPVIGMKGIGKSTTLDPVVRQWFEEREHKRNQLNNGYAPQRLIIRKSSRKDAYEDTLVSLSTHLDSRVSIKERGRRKAPSQLIDQIVIMLREKRVAVIVLDEGETLRKDTINAYRDVVAQTRDRAGGDGGTGLVIIGSPECEGLLQGQEEFGQRIPEILRIPPVTIADAYEVIREWLPQAAAMKGDAAAALQTLVRIKICREQPTHMRRLEGIVKEYARRLQLAGRLKQADGWASVPVDLKLLAAVADGFVDFLPPNATRGAKHA